MDIAIEAKHLLCGNFYSLINYKRLNVVVSRHADRIFAEKEKYESLFKKEILQSYVNKTVFYTGGVILWKSIPAITKGYYKSTIIILDLNKDSKEYKEFLFNTSYDCAIYNF